MWARSSCTLQIPRMVGWGSWISTLEPSGGEAKGRWSNQEVHQRLKWVSWCLGFSMFFYSIWFVTTGSSLIEFWREPSRIWFCFQKKDILLLPKWCRPKISVEFGSLCLLLKGCWENNNCMIVMLFSQPVLCWPLTQLLFRTVAGGATTDEAAVMGQFGVAQGQLRGTSMWWWWWWWWLL